MNLWASFTDQASITLCGWILIHFVWQGALIALCGAFLLSLCGRCSAQTRYLIATSCLFIAAICPVVTGIRLARTTGAQAEAAPLSDSVSRTNLVAESSDANLLRPEVPVFEQPERSGATNPLPTNEVSVPRAETSWREQIEAVMPWLVFGWLAGVVILTLRLLGGWWLASRAVSLGMPLRAEWTTIAERLTRQLKISRKIRWIESVQIVVPQVIGWWKPAVLVPTSILSSLTPQEIECLLIHELAHIRRYDFAVNLMQCWIETVLFFHPAVWWLSQRIRLERELACDETTVRVTGDQLTCSKALLSLANLAQLPRPSLAASEGDLTKRVHAILGTRRRGSSHVGAVLLSLLACAVVVGVIFSIGSQQAPSENEVAAAEPMKPTIEHFATEGMPVPEISGQIRDAAGKPVADALVYLRQSGRASQSRGGPVIWDDLARTTTDAEGKYRLTDVFDSETGRVAPQFDIVASKAGYALGWKHIRPKPAGATVNITLKKSESTVGRITNESGKGITNAVVRLKHLMSIRHITQADLEQGRWPSWGDAHFVSLHGFRDAPAVRTDAAGQFELSGVIGDSGAIMEIAHPDYELKTIYTATVDQLDAETAAKTKRDVLTENFSVSLKRAYRIELTVVDDESGEPISNVRYAETHKSYRIPPDLISESGTVAIPHLKSSKFLAVIYPPEKSAYLGFQQYLEWPAEQYVRKIEVRLKKGIAVSGQVVSAENAQPVEEVPVYVTRIDKNPAQVASIVPQPFPSDDKGRFTAIVPSGEYTFYPRGRIRGFLENREKQVVSKVIKVGDSGVSQQPLLELRPAPRFRLVVTDPEGNPAPDIRISANAHYSLNSYMPINVTTNASGEYLLDELYMSDSPVQEILGEEVVFRSRDNVLGAQLILERPEQDAPIEQTIEVKLKKLATVSGRTVDEAGKPVAGTSLWLYKQNYQQNGSRSIGEFTTTDAQGRFKLAGVLPGIQHSLSLRHTRYRVPNSIHTRFTSPDSSDYKFGDITLTSLTPPDVPELSAVTAPDVSELSSEAAFEMLEKQYKADYQSYRDEFDELEKKYAAKDIVARREPTPVYCQEFIKLARRDPQSEMALKSCLWIVNSRRVSGSEKAIREPRAEASKILAASFLGRLEMSQCIYVAIESFMTDPQSNRPYYTYRFIEAAEKLMQNNPHREVHARACFVLSQRLMQESLGRGLYPGISPAPKTIEQCRKYLTRLKDEFPEYEHFLYGTYGKAATRLLYDLDHMLVGQSPPDLEGTDVTGKKVSLSDFRGKLLIVDFWQGSDPATHNHHGLKHILDKAGDRVAVVGIVSESKEEVLQVVEKHDLTYPVFADGERGPMSTKWNIHTWPTTFLLDEHGTILHRGQRGERLENLLLEELAEE